jgi:hypothetical protein
MEEMTIMNAKTKTFLLLSLLCMLIGGCKKSNPAQASIVGAWTSDNLEEKLYVNNHLQYDTVVYTIVGNTAITELTSSGPMGGAYTYNNPTLSLFDTAYHSWERFTISSLTDHSFAIVDTEQVHADSIILAFETFTR